MSLKSVAAKIFAKRIYSRTQKWARNPVAAQHEVFRDLIRKAKSTRFGIDHHFDRIKSHADFVANVPIRDYEALLSRSDNGGLS